MLNGKTGPYFFDDLGGDLGKEAGVFLDAITSSKAFNRGG